MSRILAVKASKAALHFAVETGVLCDELASERASSAAWASELSYSAFRFSKGMFHPLLVFMTLTQFFAIASWSVRLPGSQFFVVDIILLLLFIYIEENNASPKALFLAKNKAFLSKNDPFLIKNKTFLSKNEPFLTKNEPFLSNYKAFLVKNEPFLTKNKVFLIKNELFLTKNKTILQPLAA